MRDPVERGIRINKYLAACGICSRREADRLIAEGAVTVNGAIPEPGTVVTPQDAICVNGKAVTRPKERKVILAFYKPVGLTCTERDAHAEKVLSDYVKYPVRVTYAGRLDKDSEGLLLLTNDGDLIDRMMRGSAGHEKEYIVRVSRELGGDALKRMAAGIYLKDLGQKTRPCEVEQTGKYTFRIVLTQGLNRQIRRMCKAVGYEVTQLRRVRVVNITLGNLKPGEYRELTEEERRELYRICAGSAEGKAAQEAGHLPEKL